MSPSVSVRLLLTQSDARLLALAADGHERAFEALVQRYRRPLLRYCRRLLLPDERAEDALQQALLQAWLALQHGAEVTDVRSWLYRTVHNAAMNARRVSGYDYSTLSESLCGADAPQADLDRRIAVRETLAGLASLPEMQREALLRTAVEGRSHQQVASDLGLSEGALRGLVYRARATLRAAATAVTPPPALSWALSSGARGTPVVERLAELGAGSGSVGLGALFVKGGAVAVTAGVLAGGIGAVHGHAKAGPRHIVERESQIADPMHASRFVAQAPSSHDAPRELERTVRRPAGRTVTHTTPSRSRAIGAPPVGAPKPSTAGAIAPPPIARSMIPVDHHASQSDETIRPGPQDMQASHDSIYGKGDGTSNSPTGSTQSAPDGGREASGGPTQYGSHDGEPQGQTSALPVTAEAAPSGVSTGDG